MPLRTENEQAAGVENQLLLDPDFLLDFGDCGVALNPAWRLLQALGISADGLTILGSGNNPRGPFEGWVATLSSGCYPNCDASTTVPFLNVGDFICFQSAFAAGASYANCDNSTTPPILNVSDFICFQSAFAAGCSAP